MAVCRTARGTASRHLVTSRRDGVLSRCSKDLASLHNSRSSLSTKRAATTDDGRHCLCGEARAEARAQLAGHEAQEEALKRKKKAEADGNLEAAKAAGEDTRPWYGGPPLPRARVEISLSLRLPPMWIKRDKSKARRRRRSAVFPLLLVPAPADDVVDIHRGPPA